MVRLLVVDEPSGQTTLVFYAARMTQLRKSSLTPSQSEITSSNLLQCFTLAGSKSPALDQLPLDCAEPFLVTPFLLTLCRIPLQFESRTLVSAAPAGGTGKVSDQPLRRNGELTPV